MFSVRQICKSLYDAILKKNKNRTISMIENGNIVSKDSIKNMHHTNENFYLSCCKEILLNSVKEETIKNLPQKIIPPLVNIINEYSEEIAEDHPSLHTPIITKNLLFYNEHSLECLNGLKFRIPNPDRPSPQPNPSKPLGPDWPPM